MTCLTHVGDRTMHDVFSSYMYVGVIWPRGVVLTVYSWSFSTGELARRLLTDVGGFSSVRLKSLDGVS